MKLHHINCQDSKCNVCLKDAIKLEKYLDERTETENKIDHLGKYHKWLSDKGINPETEIGWFTSDAFDDENIKQYIKWFKDDLIPLFASMKGNREGFVEGVVFTHPDGKMAKLRRDMFDWYKGKRHLNYKE